MIVLVAAASKYGATSEIADRIGAALAEHGVDAEVRGLEEVVDLGRYDAFVLGSAVYLGKWRKTARTFVDGHAGELAQRPTWLFSSGPTVDPPRAADPLDSVQGEALAATINAREHRLFAGKLDKSKLNLAEKAAIRVARASDGDHRDWPAIDEWAAAIALDLQHDRVARSSA